MKKFNNKRTRGYDSRAEYRRAIFLRTLQQSRTISKLEQQKKFNLVVNGQHICAYIADFVYVDSNGSTVVEDVKGIVTDVYRLKKKLMHACHGININEVRCDEVTKQLTQPKTTNNTKLVK
ncbi:endonuclease [Abalone shriveling syndrome-associated virus]|uniref:endonuclease n=1 Tax=Abalone shriveling syndrome-associated virus TaxID=491893 RepID=UPI0001881BC2|nr:endonuclease [Abalone shriveling syndrome-associated virus]ACJ72003.1 endonuclease [Abalone shriveling syndrome-associated virus]